MVTDGPAPEEVEGAVNQLRAARANDLLTVAGRASAIQEANAVRGDPSAVGAGMEALAGVTAADVHRVARRWLVAPNRTVVVAHPVGTSR